MVSTLGRTPVPVAESILLRVRLPLPPACDPPERRRLRPRAAAFPWRRLSLLHGPTACDSSPRGVRAGLHPHPPRSEEHTSELQSRGHLVCRLLLEENKS